MYIKILISVLICWLPQLCFSQNISWEDFVEDYLSIETQEEESTTLQSLSEELFYIHQNPFNINTVKSSQLLQLPFLSQAQADSIIAYRDKYGPLLSLGELQFVKWLNKQTIDYLCLFVFCEDKSIHKIPTTHSKHELVGNFSLPLYQREGFKNASNMYLGMPSGQTWRYRGNTNTGFEWGASLQNDEGEPFAKNGNKPFDYYSFYIGSNTYKSHSLIKQWIIGDYRINFGRGLTIGEGFMNSALAEISFSQSTSMMQIRKHSSTDEINFFRGGAIMLGMNNSLLTLFASHRNIDAITNKEGLITSVLKTGLHRTSLERERKGNVGCTTGGTALKWSTMHLSLGLSAVFTHFDTPFTSEGALYKTYYMNGKNFGNYSFHFQFSKDHWSILGEEAVDNNGGIALQNIIKYSPRWSTQFTLLQHYYDKQYNAPFAYSYSIKSKIQNENGLLLGAHFSFAQNWDIKTYADYTYHPFAAYRTSLPSHSFVFGLQTNWHPTKQIQWSLRYKTRTSQTDNSDKTALNTTQKHSLKLQADYPLGTFTSTSAVMITMVKSTEDNTKWGKMIYQRASLKKSKWNYSGMFAWFQTHDYSTAIYLYEPQFLYSFSFPSCFYHGIRGVIKAEYKISEQIEAGLKATSTHYFDRETISSAQQLINSSWKNDFYVQLRWKFYHSKKKKEHPIILRKLKL